MNVLSTFVGNALAAINMKVSTQASVLLSLLASGVVSGTTIGEINGNKFVSPLKNQAVIGVEGLVLAKGPSGFWIRSTTPTADAAVSDAIYVYSKTAGANLTAGDVVTLSGKVAEYRSSSAYIYLTEISNPTEVTVVSSGNAVTPKVIGVDTLNPPTEQYTSLDNGDIYGLPNNVSQISVVNPVLQPSKYGLDFWESLSGELVTIKSPRGLGRPNSYRNTWVVGDWPKTGTNAHGGLTMTSKDSNPEAIIIGDPLDGTKNPSDSKMGDSYADITGVVQYAFGFYTVFPLTALSRTASAESPYPKTTLTSDNKCKGITVGSYNVQNLAPTSAHLPNVAQQIVDNLRNPDIVFIQEVQDNSGENDDGTVSANKTLNALVAAIANHTGGVTYSWTDIDPVNDQDGGAPGGNIRCAYLYRPDVVELYNPNPGSSTDANEVVKDSKGLPSLKYNPGRVAPASAAWDATRKPLAAMWKAKKGSSKIPFFTVNVHWSSKGGSSSLQGDARPPVNGVVERRSQQAAITGVSKPARTALTPGIRQADPRRQRQRARAGRRRL
jgi:predicted extracellular nuclease